MDRSTLTAYDQAAAAFAQDWHDQPPPADLHALVTRFFAKGTTADIGCGSGREVAWLAANGFPARGFDASEGLLAEARRRYPTLAFAYAELPDLRGIAADCFDNVLCETVVMHVGRAVIAPSVRRMMAILKPGGILYVSWRVTEGIDVRDPWGRLYAAFDRSLVLTPLAGAAILVDDETVSASSGKQIHRVVARMP